jgi:anti-sigma factor RsiW
LDTAEQPRDILLFAYIDGELGKDQQQAVQRLLARDPDARQRAAHFQELNMLLRAAYREDSRMLS